jgi:hypothetical protein
VKPSPFSSDERQEIGKAIAIAGLCALVVEAIRLGADEVRAWRARARCDAPETPHEPKP